MDSVTICNLALAMVGIPAIVSFEDANNNAKLCKAFFPILRDRCLRDHTWSFAAAFSVLQTTTEESFDPAYRFVAALPHDLIRITGLVSGAPYRRVGDRILVNESDPVLSYTRRVENAGAFDEFFIEALQYLIASEIGMANTRDSQLIQLYHMKYENAIAKARSVDSQENIHAFQCAPRQSNWIAARGRAGTCRTGKSVWTEGTEGKQV